MPSVRINGGIGARISAKAPSNIALIKYMGKQKIGDPGRHQDSSRNLPLNPSISMTLKSLCTHAEITLSEPASSLKWVPELPRGLEGVKDAVVPPLQGADIDRVFCHIERVRRALPELFQRLGVEFKASPEAQGFHGTLKTANTFPASSGIASSASSFAAITLATAAAWLAENGSDSEKENEIFERAWKADPRLRQVLAQLSRQGSGSSCRSFEGPWVEWEEESTRLLDSSGMPSLSHFVVLIKTQPKTVSSSEAHSRVETSPLWQGRVSRVHARVEQVRLSLLSGDLRSLAQVAWTESWEMHSLFHTSPEPFSYWEPGTIHGLHWLGRYLRENSPDVATDRSEGIPPPVVTLDAGPNLHVIVRSQDRDLWRLRLRECYSDHEIRILEDEPGEGAEL